MSHRVGLDKATVVEAAAKLVDEEGIEALSLSRLAERLGMRTPSLYNHIGGLPGLKQELTRSCLRDLSEIITRASVGKSRTEAIFAFSDAYLGYARKVPGRYALTQQAPSPTDHETQDIARQIIEVIQAILAPYNLSEEESIHAIRGLRSIVHGFIFLESAGGFGLTVDRDTSFHWLINLFISGLNSSNGR